VRDYWRAFDAVDQLITIVAGVMETLVVYDGLLAVEPYRLAIDGGTELRRVDFAVRGDDPFHNPGQVLLMDGPTAALTGVVYPTAITHKWGRLDDPAQSRMIVTGLFVEGDGLET